MWRLLSVGDGMMTMTEWPWGSLLHTITSLGLCYLTVMWRALLKFPLALGSLLLSGEGCVASEKALDSESEELFELLLCPLIVSLSVPQFLCLQEGNENTCLLYFRGLL